MWIKLIHGGQFDIVGQIVNVPVDVNQMVTMQSSAQRF